MRAQFILIGLCLCGIFFSISSAINKSANENNEKSKELKYEKLVGNTAENLAAIKRECEKDLPRNKECVLVYDYVPVTKE